MEKLIELLKNKKIFIVSPHLDDAVLSCSGLIMSLKNPSQVMVINVFTKAHKGPYTMSGKKFLKLTGFADAYKLYEARKKEDNRALSELGIEFINLGFTEALFRKKNSLLGKFIPEFNHIYPTFRFHVMRKVQKNDPTLKKIKSTLLKYIPQNSVVFVPCGIGNHADHKALRMICEEGFKNVILYADFPYHVINRVSKIQDRQKVELSVNYKKKKNLITCYESQIKCLFPNGTIPEKKEVFFIPRI